MTAPKRGKPMFRESLCFDDVMLVPQYSEIGSRADVDISFKFHKKLGVSIQLGNPIVPANMATITGCQMAEAVYKSRGLALVHRFMPAREQLSVLTNLMTEHGHIAGCHVGLSVGVKDNDKENVALFADGGAQILCIDVAHGDSKQCVDMAHWISQKYPQITLIAGNVATGSGARRLWEAGADIVKVGVGPGSLCTTRIETGNGVPQLSAIMDVSETQHQLLELERTKYPGEMKRAYPFISDGGLKNVGDIVKACCFADLVMTGSMFAGCEETPGKLIVKDGISVKEYVGSSTHKSNHIEGISALVPYKGRYQDILTKMIEGLQSGCSYQGVDNLTDLKDNPVFVRITTNGLRESHPHIMMK